MDDDNDYKKSQHLQKVTMQSSEEAELKCLCEQLDDTINDFFGTLTELLNTRRDLENFIKEGFFLMARARYSMGAKSVTSTQYNPDDLQKAFCYVNLCSGPNGNISFLPDISTAKAQSCAPGRLVSSSGSGFDPDSECVELDRIDVTLGEEQNADFQPGGLRRRNLPQDDLKSGASEGDITSASSLEHLVSGMERVSCGETDVPEEQDVSESSTSSVSCREPGKDPLLWFGVLVPQSLRQSQLAFRRAVELSCRVATLQHRLTCCQASYKEMMGKKSRIVKELCKMSAKTDPEDNKETDHCENDQENALPDYHDVTEAAS